MTVAMNVAYIVALVVISLLLLSPITIVPVSSDNSPGRNIPIGRKKPDAFADILTPISTTEEYGEWISTKDRLPEDGQSVIIAYNVSVYVTSIAVVGATYDEDQGFVDTGYEEMWFGNGYPKVIAWMPVPKPPVNTEDDEE